MATRLEQDKSTIREKVEFLTELFTDQPDAAHVFVPSATAVLDSGLAFRVVHPDGFTATTDMPIALGGAEDAASPGWLLSAATAACYATVIAMRAAQLEIPLSTLEVAVDAEADARGLLGVPEDVSAALTSVKIHVRIESDVASHDELREVVRWADDHSPASSTIRRATPVEFDIATGQG